MKKFTDAELKKLTSQRIDPDLNMPDFKKAGISQTEALCKTASYFCDLFNQLEDNAEKVKLIERYGALWQEMNQ